MRPRLGMMCLTMSSLVLAFDAHAGAPTTMYIRNLGGRLTRVQVAVGPVAPCDSRDDRMLLDAVLAPGEQRVLLVDAISVCARHTAGGTTLDWSPSRWLSGGVRCRPRGACWPDPRVPIVFDVLP